MWEFNHREVYNEDREENPYDRIFSIVPIKKIGSPRWTWDISRYEIEECWTSLEQPSAWENGYYLRHDKTITICSYTSAEEATACLRLLAWVLNAPTEVPLDQIISQKLIDLLPESKIDELAAIREKENREEEIRQAECRENGSCVYCFELDNKFCKIGFTSRIKIRTAAVRRQSGHKVIRRAFTQGFEVDEARKIESECHDFFSTKRIWGEIFQTSFEEACEKLKTYSEIFIEECGL